VHRYGLLLAHGQVPAVQVQTHGGLQRGMVVEGLVQLQHAQPQRRQASQDRHLRAARRPEPAPPRAGGRRVGTCWLSAQQGPRLGASGASAEGYVHGGLVVCEQWELVWDAGTVAAAEEGSRGGVPAAGAVYEDGRLARAGCAAEDGG